MVLVCSFRRDLTSWLVNFQIVYKIGKKTIFVVLGESNLKVKVLV